MEIKLELPADVAAADGEPLTAGELSAAGAATVRRQAEEATKGIYAFYKSWEEVAAKLASLTRHGLEVGFRAKPVGAVALVKATKGDLSAGEIATLAVEELGFDKGSLGGDVDADGKEHYQLDLAGAGKLVVIAFGPGHGWEKLS